MKVLVDRQENGQTSFKVGGDTDPNGLFEPNYSTAYALGIGESSKPSLHVRWHTDGSIHHVICDSAQQASAQLRQMALEMRTLAAAYEHWAAVNLMASEVQPLFDNDGHPKTRW